MVVETYTRIPTTTSIVNVIKSSSIVKWRKVFPKEKNEVQMDWRTWREISTNVSYTGKEKLAKGYLACAAHVNIVGSHNGPSLLASRTILWWISSYQSIYQFIHQSNNQSIYINLSIYLSINQSIYLSTYQCINQSSCLSNYQSINQSIYLALYLPINISIYRSTYLSTYFSTYPPTYLYVCLLNHVSMTTKCNI